MLRLAVHHVSTYHWPLAEEIRRYRAAGFTGIGLWRQKVDDLGLEHVRDLLDGSGLRVTSYHWVGGFTGMDGRSFEESLQDAKSTMEQAAGLKAEYVAVHTGGRGGHTRPHALRIARSALNCLVRYAQDWGTRLAIEPQHVHCASDWSILTSLSAATEFVRSLPGAEDSVRLILDAYHCRFDDEFWKLLPTIVPWLGLVQVADRHGEPQADQQRAPLAAGDLPLGRLVAELLEADYQGFFELEVFGDEVEDMGYDTLLSNTQQFFRPFGMASPGHHES